jgi:hypothetical protein
MAELTIDEMRAKVMEADAAAMAEQNKKREELMKPLNTFLASKELAKVKKDVDEMAVAFADDDMWNHKFRAIQMALKLL